MKRYYINPNLPETPMRENKQVGDWVKLKDVEQLQALTKEFAEAVMHLVDYGETNELGKSHEEFYIQAQQYLDSIKEGV